MSYPSEHDVYENDEINDRYTITQLHCYCCPRLDGKRSSMSDDESSYPLRRVVKVNPANMRHADPTESYTLSCGHTII